MNALRNLATMKHLIRDTFRQARASGISWIMLALTAICVLVCLSVSVTGDVSLHEEDEPDYFLAAAFRSRRDHSAASQPATRASAQRQS